MRARVRVAHLCACPIREFLPLDRAREHTERVISNPRLFNRRFQRASMFNALTAEETESTDVGESSRERYRGRRACAIREISMALRG